ncbi:MAG: hypothetical protein FJ276_31895 [Planctomycetes bacterium]|nr:hypothetical protein [Planctomycetota bacterium]
MKTKDVAAVIAARIVKRNMPGVGELTSTDAPYFNSIHGGAYLELVVADNGGGLTETLGPSFDRDLQEKQSQLRPHYNRWLGTGKPGRDAAIARYAFEQWSTSRPVSRLLHPDSPRGLWWVYDITRYYHGYLGLRSGCAQVGLDLRAHGYTEGAVLSGAREFAGTLIQVVLPRLRMDELRSQTTRPPGPPRTSSDAMLIRLADCSHLQAVVQRVENAAAGARDTTLVLDCATCSLEPETALHLLLVLSRLQNPADNVLVVMANVPTGHESIVGAMREFTGFDQRERLVPVLFTSGRCDLAGPGADRYRSEIREVMTGGRLPVPASPDPGGAGLEPGPAEVERFFLRNSHLFHLTTHYNVGVLSASVHESFSGGRYGWLSWR